MKMNVTPGEYLEIMDVIGRREIDNVDYSEELVRRFGCKYFHSYRVILREDVPYVPFLSMGVHRFEEEVIDV